MARRRRAAKRKLMPDPVHNSDVVAKFINVIMQEGKKSIAERIVYGAFEEIAKKSKGVQPLEIFCKALDNVSPSVEVRARRVGGSTYQIPVEVRAQRKQSLAMRWLIESATERSGASMMERLAAELLDATENRGNAFKKKEDVHRMAQANKAFAHFNKERERS